MNSLLENSERRFEGLSRRTQIARLRRLAEYALSAYDLPAVRLSLLNHLFNTGFRVDAPGERYVLRIHRAASPAPETVGSELAWLAALRRDTTLEVPSPVPTRTGDLLTTATSPGLPRPYICVLFRWLSGHKLRRGLTPRHMERVGRLMASLQNHALRWERPTGFQRARVDYPIDSARWLPDPFAPEVLESIRTLVAGALSEGEAAKVKAALERVRDVEKRLAEEPSTFGLIHADLHYHNLLFEGDTVRALDFDDCGFGPLLYDPCVMLNEILGWPNYAPLRAGLLAGYRQVLPLPDEHESLLDTFIALRRIQDALWILNMREHTAIRTHWASEARLQFAPLDALLSTQL